MPKFYVTDWQNRFIIDTNTHLQACQKAVKSWEDKQKSIGKFICFGNKGFPSISDKNCLETSFVKRLKSG